MSARFINLKTLTQQSLMLLAPHADDELMGCGGWLIKTKATKIQRDIVLFTKTDNVREQEMKAALAGLDLNEIIHLNLPEFWRRKNIAEKSKVLLLNKLLITRLPDFLLIPSIRDKHPDHTQAAKLLGKALKHPDLKNYEPEILQYEVFVPHDRPDVFLNISDVEEEKMARINKYSTEEKKYQLSEISSALNTFRGKTFLRRHLKSVEAYQSITKSALMSYGKEKETQNANIWN